MEVISRLQHYDTQHKARVESITAWAVSTARGMKEAFDTYVNKEITEMKDILSMLSSVQQEVDDELKAVKQLEQSYFNTNDRLNVLLDSANRHKIKKIQYSTPMPRYPPVSATYMPELLETNTKEETLSSEIDELSVELIAETIIVVGQVSEMREKIDRHARNFTRVMNNMETVLDELLRRRGLGGTT
jgi:hypothetical protein